MEGAPRRFACTLCGRCCDRPPELLISEAADLADTFVFRLMFRLYWLPEDLRTYLATQSGGTACSAAFFDSRRLLGAFAARKYPVKAAIDGKRVRYTKYLMISALTVDTSRGTCPALQARRCGVYERRPSACRSVPVHYSRAEALAESAFDAFVGTPGYQCDTSDSAPAVLAGGRIVSPEFRVARADAAGIAERERSWRAAIAGRMNTDCPTAPLPRMEEVEANATAGATTVSMHAAWRIAAGAGFIAPAESTRLIQLQLGVIGRELALGRCTHETRATLTEMQAEYRDSLISGGVSAA